MAGSQTQVLLCSLVIFFSSLAFLFSSLLAIVALKANPPSLCRYRHVLVLYGLLGQGYSICELLIVPYWYVADGDFILYAVGPVSLGVSAQVVLVLFSCFFMATLLLISYSFIFQYIQICRHSFFTDFPHHHVYSLLIACIIFANWILIVFYCFSPSEAKIERAEDVVNSTIGLSLHSRAMLGVSLEIQRGDKLFYTLIAEMLALLAIIATTAIICANRILAKVSSSIISTRRKKVYGGIFRLLLMQCIAPCIFAIIPCTFNVSSALLGFDIGTTVPLVLAIMLPMYPLFNPLIVIFHVKDYHLYIISVVCCTEEMRRKSVDDLELTDSRQRRMTLAERRQSTRVNLF